MTLLRLGPPAGVGLGLTAIGYRENAAESASTVLGLKLLFAIPPTALVLSALFVFRSYPLTKARHREVVEALARAPGKRPEGELYQSLQT